MNTIIINGVRIQSGSNVTVLNGRVMVDGKDATPDSKTINIVVQGNVGDLVVDACDSVQVTGDVAFVKTQSGNIKIGGNVTDSIQTMSGDVKCGTVGGSVKTMSGDIKHSKQ